MRSYIIKPLDIGVQVKVLKENAAPFSTQTLAPRKSVPKTQEQPVTAGPPLAPVSEMLVPSTNANENGSNKESEGVLFLLLCHCFC